MVLLDEALAVGDKSFKQKNKRNLEKFCSDRATILLALHALEFLQQACWLYKDKIRFAGTASETVDCYLPSLGQNSEVEGLASGINKLPAT